MRCERRRCKARLFVPRLTKRANHRYEDRRVGRPVKEFEQPR